MTDEEAKKILNTVLLFGKCDCPKEEIEECLKRAIKALEQEPCEDAISRQAVKEKLREEWVKYVPMELDINLSFVLEKISELPSATPKPKTGKWIPDDTICEDTLYRCSNCGNVYYSDYGDVMDLGYKYCPNCGARMESEVRDV